MAKLNWVNVSENIVAGTALMAMGAAGALAYEHRHIAKNHMKKLKKHLKKRIKR